MTVVVRLMLHYGIVWYLISLERINKLRARLLVRHRQTPHVYEIRFPIDTTSISIKLREDEKNEKSENSLKFDVKLR